MKEVKMYQARDGKVFANAKDCAEHDMIDGVEVYFHDGDGDEFNIGTAYSNEDIKNIIKTYWNNLNNSMSSTTYEEIVDMYQNAWFTCEVLEERIDVSSITKVDIEITVTDDIDYYFK